MEGLSNENKGQSVGVIGVKVDFTHSSLSLGFTGVEIVHRKW